MGFSPDTPTNRQSKTLILCFDGTLDRYDKAISNIARLVSFFEKNDPERQLVYYQAGVGTSIGPAYFGRAVQYVEDVWDSAFASSLDRHVMGGYTFLMNHWKQGDRICLFGFSRGAYTARALNGMLYHVGLLPPSMTEEVRFAYAIYKHQKESAQYKLDFSRTVSVAFIGVFDTVSSVGTMLPRTLPFPGDNHMVRVFRHAMSLDEHRAAFRAQPWIRSVPPSNSHSNGEDGTGMKGKPRAGMVRSAVGAVADESTKQAREMGMGTGTGSQHGYKSAAEREREQTVHVEQEDAARVFEAVMPPDSSKGTDCKEVYFAGCHTDIGGGSVPNHTKYSLEMIPLRWMIKEILLSNSTAGILFRDDPRLKDMGIYLPTNVVGRPGEESPVRVLGDESGMRMRTRTGESVAEGSMDGETMRSASASYPVQEPHDQSSASASNSNSNSQSHSQPIPPPAPSTVPNPPSLVPPSSSTIPKSNIPLPEGSHSSPHAPPPESSSSPSHSIMPIDARPEDVVCKINDKLMKNPAWWFLEFVPFVVRWQDERDGVHTGIRINLFRPRQIAPPPSPSNPNSSLNPDPLGANIQSSAPALYHVSVKMRMESEARDAKKRSAWLGKKGYRPRAKLMAGGEPEYVS